MTKVVPSYVYMLPPVYLGEGRKISAPKVNKAVSTTPNKISADDVVYALRILRTSQPAKVIAQWLGTTSRNVATAARLPVQDGRIKITYKKGIGRYRFVRVKPKTPLTTRNFNIRPL